MNRKQICQIKEEKKEREFYQSEERGEENAEKIKAVGLREGLGTGFINAFLLLKFSWKKQLGNAEILKFPWGLCENKLNEVGQNWNN